ncbi:MAG: response regulator FixJ [Gammaproteobacteria bacterium]|nr:response regulator FixJ [Gammaproteobacteria bacterium]MDX2486288.1 response regulator FixJ [Gammaproteobacteria bacterium]
MQETEEDRAIVFIVDDDASVRDSLRWLIESVQLQVQCFATAQEFLQGYQNQQTGCVVLDVRMPGLSGLDLQEELRQQGFVLPVIIITGHADVPMAVRAFKSGVFDFIEKPFNDQHLIDRIHQAINKSRSQKVNIQRWQDARDRLQKLSSREVQVLDCIVSGSSNKTMARELDISVKTIETHRANLMSKMQAGSVSELVRIALLAERGKEG